MMSDLEKLDVMLRSHLFIEIDTEKRSANGNTENREGLANENEIRTYTATGH